MRAQKSYIVSIKLTLLRAPVSKEKPRDIEVKSKGQKIRNQVFMS